MLRDGAGNHGTSKEIDKDMKDQNRVLGRRGARELSPTEADLVNGGFITFSFCTAGPTGDGDNHPGEVGC